MHRRHYWDYLGRCSIRHWFYGYVIVEMQQCTICGVKKGYGPITTRVDNRR